MLVDVQPPPAGGVGDFRHPFFVWGEGLEEERFCECLPRVLATEAFFSPSF